MSCVRCLLVVHTTILDAFLIRQGLLRPTKIRTVPIVRRNSARCIRLILERIDLPIVKIYIYLILYCNWWFRIFLFLHSIISCMF